jgi:hypothetical protein
MGDMHTRGQDDQFAPCCRPRQNGHTLHHRPQGGHQNKQGEIVRVGLVQGRDDLIDGRRAEMPALFLFRLAQFDRRRKQTVSIMDTLILCNKVVIQMSGLTPIATMKPTGPVASPAASTSCHLPANTDPQLPLPPPTPTTTTLSTSLCVMGAQTTPTPAHTASASRRKQQLLIESPSSYSVAGVDWATAIWNADVR